MTAVFKLAHSFYVISIYLHIIQSRVRTGATFIVGQV